MVCPGPAHPVKRIGKLSDDCLERFGQCFAPGDQHVVETAPCMTLGANPQCLSQPTPDAVSLDYPKIGDGIRGMAFIEAVVRSSHEGGVWTPLGV